MQAVSSFGQNVADDLKGSFSTANQVPGTSSLSTGQAPSSNQQFMQDKSPAFGGYQQQGFQGQQQPLQQNQMGYQQGLQGQGQQFSGQQLPQQQQQQGLQGQQFGQQNLGQQQNLQNQQNLQSQQNLQNLQNQQNLQSQQNLQNLQGQQNLQQGFQAQQFLPQQNIQQGYLQSNLQLEQQLLPATQIQIAPVVLEHRDIAPVIHEKFRREEVEEITPVIHREREKTEIHKITQPVHTSAVLGVITEEATLPAKFSEMRTPSMLPPATILPRREELSAQKMRIDKAPVVIETERKRVIEEVTPVVYKEVVEPHLTRLTQPIYEKIVEGDVYISETRAAQVIAPSITTATTQTSIPIQTTQYVQQSVPVQIPIISQMPIYSKNIEVADTFVKEGVPITSSASRGLFGRRAV